MILTPVRTLFALALASTSVVVGCGGAPPPVAKVASTQSAIRAAHENGAESIPSAQIYLKYATDQMATAEKLIKEGDNEKAEWILSRAETDAELSVALAKEVSTKNAALAAQEKVRALQKK
ncbi:MAG: DUF4398 domain-containing protein [Polyangiaceae bacterium]